MRRSPPRYTRQLGFIYPFQDMYRSQAGISASSMLRVQEMLHPTLRGIMPTEAYDLSDSTSARSHAPTTVPSISSPATSAPTSQPPPPDSSGTTSDISDEDTVDTLSDPAVQALSESQFRGLTLRLPPCDRVLHPATRDMRSRVDRLLSVVAVAREIPGMVMLRMDAGRAITRPDVLLAQTQLESSCNPDARGREASGGYSYGMFQIYDRVARGLSRYRQGLGPMMRDALPPPPRTQSGDTGNDAWRPVLTGRSGLWWSMLLLWRYVEWYQAWFNTTNSGIIVPRPRPNRPAQELADARDIADYINAIRETVPEEAAVLLFRPWMKAGSLRGISLGLQSGMTTQAISCLVHQMELNSGVDAGMRVPVPSIAPDTTDPEAGLL